MINRKTKIVAIQNYNFKSVAFNNFKIFKIFQKKKEKFKKLKNTHKKPFKIVYNICIYLYFLSFSFYLFLSFLYKKPFSFKLITLKNYI